MEKKPDHEHDPTDDQDIEIPKAAAQAWHNHSSSTRPTSEFDARRQNFKPEPSRFRIEAMNKLAMSRTGSSANWDFKQSLWDSFEIVTVSKRLEAGLMSDNPFEELESPDSGQVIRKRGESKHSLRNLFNLMSSRRFNEPPKPRKDDPQF